MTDLIYKIEFYSDWHCGSGLSSGAGADLLVIKDKNGLPFIPGKTMKGLLRDAAVTLKEADVINEATVDQLFGKPSVKAGEDNNTVDQPSEEGCCYFSNATLTESVQQAVSDNKKILFRNISSTAIGESGQAIEHSLRTMEVTVPLPLYAKISNSTPEQQDVLIRSMKMIKRLGTGRNRGLGRCDISIVKGDTK